MKLLWTVLMAGVSLAGKSEANAEDPRTTLVNAKNAVVEAALALRQSRLDWQRAQALVDEAEAGLKAADVEREKALEQGRAVDGAAPSVAAAELRWRAAVTALDGQAGRLSRAEGRLQSAEAALQRAEAAWKRRQP
jgi:hypothetical protein